MNTQIIEQTEKKYKLLSRIGGWVLLIAVFFVANDPTPLSVVCMVAGLVAFLWGRWGKWFNHE